VIVLASQSPARRRILEAAGVAVTVDPAAIDEDPVKRAFRQEGRSAADCATALAEKKAAAVASRHEGAPVIGADQILDCGGTWFDKPRDIEDARAQLRALRGKSHELATAAVVVRDGATLWHQVERPRLVMRNFTDAYLDRYVAAMGAEICHMVGGYALEGLGAQLFARVDGDYFAILGLPLLPLLEFLRSEGAVPS
jgi:septum formation protein